MRNFDKLLQTSLRNLQSYGQLFFTSNQLFYELCRAELNPIGLELKTSAALFGLSALPALFFVRRKPKSALGWLAASACGFGVLAFSRTIPHTLSPIISRSEFERKLTDYLSKNEKPDGLLKIKTETQFLNSFPDDLMLYGLPKLLICESDEIAQMLRANQFHLETPCAVLSLREAVPLNKAFQKMLAHAGEPQVFFLHNASLPSFSLIPNLRQKMALKNEIPLRSIGLRPVHARRLHLFAERTQNKRQTVNLEEFAYLTESEKRWLENGFTAEVAAVSPIRLLRVLRRIILGLEIPPSVWKINLPERNLGFMQ